MRYLPTKKTVRGLFKAEGFLELNLPERTLLELDRLEDLGELEAYSLYLRGQALQKLDRYEEAIDALQEAARTIPAPLNQRVWEDLSHCFRHQGLEELADVAELFAEDPMGGADRDFTDSADEDTWLEDDEEFRFDEYSFDEEADPWNRSDFPSCTDFAQYNFEDEEESSIRDSEFNHKPPQK